LELELELTHLPFKAVNALHRFRAIYLITTKAIFLY
jgi:hypothetical protein